jgi:hypothetical protein
LSACERWQDIQGDPEGDEQGVDAWMLIVWCLRNDEEGKEVEGKIGEF